MNLIKVLNNEGDEYYFQPGYHSSPIASIYGRSTDTKYGHCKVMSAWDSNLDHSVGYACSAKSGYDIWGRIKKTEGTLDFTGGVRSFSIDYPLEYGQGDIYVIDLRLNDKSLLNDGYYSGKVYYSANKIHFDISNVNAALGGSSNKYVLFYRVVNK